MNSLMVMPQLIDGQIEESLRLVPCLEMLHLISKREYDMDFELLSSNSCMTRMDTGNERHCRTVYTWAC